MRGGKTSWIPLLSCRFSWSKAFRVRVFHKRCCSSILPSQLQIRLYQGCRFAGVNPSSWAAVIHLIWQVFNSRGNRSFFFSPPSAPSFRLRQDSHSQIYPHIPSEWNAVNSFFFFLLCLWSELFSEYKAKQLIWSKLPIIFIITVIIALPWPQVPSRNSREGFWFSTSCSLEELRVRQSSVEDMLLSAASDLAAELETYRSGAAHRNPFRVLWAATEEESV